MSTFGERFEEEINRIGVTHVANMLGVARNTIYNWMARGNVPLSSLMALRGTLDLDVEYVITGKRSSDSLTQDEQLLIERFRAAPLAVKAAAMAALAAGSDESIQKKRRGVTVVGTGNRTAGGDYTEKK